MFVALHFIGVTNAVLLRIENKNQVERLLDCGKYTKDCINSFSYTMLLALFTISNCYCKELLCLLHEITVLMTRACCRRSMYFLDCPLVVYYNTTPICSNTPLIYFSSALIDFVVFVLVFIKKRLYFFQCTLYYSIYYVLIWFVGSYNFKPKEMI